MNKKPIIISFTIIALIIVSSIIYLLIPKSYIVFKTAPEEVTVLIDGKDKKDIKNGDKITISPGKHSFVIYRNEFNPFRTDVNIKNGENIEIVSVLTALTENAKKLLNNDKSSYVIEKFTAINMDKQVEILTKKYPIMKVLPIENRNYVISSCRSEKFPNDPYKIALCVDIPQEDVKDMVKQDIRSHGFNPDDYEYIWNNYLSGVE